MDAAANFTQWLGGGLVGFALVSAALSLCENLRAHTLRLLAIFFVAALALFSNDVTTYFLAIFIVATAVTELEFLQNLAAIIRGNKEYFDYKKEALSKERKLDILANEAAQSAVVVESGLSATAESELDNSRATGESNDAPSLISVQPVSLENNSDFEKAPSSPPNAEYDAESMQPDLNQEVPIAPISKNPPLPRVGENIKTSGDIRRIYEYEAKAFDSLELLYGKAIERGVRFRGDKSVIEVDGLIANFDGETDLVVEVKYLSSGRNFISWVELIGFQLKKIGSQYRQITRRSAIIHFVLILEAGVVLTNRQKNALNTLEVKHVSVFTTDYLEKF